MIYGFTGSREGLNSNQKNKIKKLLSKALATYKTIEVHHGDCVGSDEDFHKLCVKLSSNINIFIHPPACDKLRAYCKSDNVLTEKDFLTRNKDIVNSCDILIACPLSSEEILRSGTWATIRHAEKLGKKIKMYPKNE